MCCSACGPSHGNLIRIPSTLTDVQYLWTAVLSSSVVFTHTEQKDLPQPHDTHDNMLCFGAVERHSLCDSFRHAVGRTVLTCQSRHRITYRIAQWQRETEPLFDSPAVTQRVCIWFIPAHLPACCQSGQSMACHPLGKENLKNLVRSSKRCVTLNWGWMHEELYMWISFGGAKKGGIMNFILWREKCKNDVAGFYRVLNILFFIGQIRKVCWMWHRRKKIIKQWSHIFRLKILVSSNVCLSSAADSDKICIKTESESWF